MFILKYNRIILIILLILLHSSFIFSQEAIENVPEDSEEIITAESLPVQEKEKGQFHMFLNNNMIFALSIENGGFGFGETLTVEYTMPFHLSLGLESGYYGFKSEIEKDNNIVVGGFSLIPIYFVAEYEFKLVENFYLSPVLKGGAAYTNARINGWFGGDTFSGIFEGGVRIKAFFNKGLLVEGNVMYIGLIEKSGIISMLSLGVGFGF